MKIRAAVLNAMGAALPYAKSKPLTIETLERLARDEEPRVRAMLAEEIKHLDCVPKDVVKRLAGDAEILVCAPVIEYSPLLSDTDLLEVVAVAHANAMLAAVARRKGLSGEVLRVGSDLRLIIRVSFIGKAAELSIQEDVIEPCA